MKPGIPWSVKGIEQQARAAAKEAARQSGMTIGEWLNTVILDSADGDDLERRYRRPPYRPKPLPGTGQGEGEDVTLRLEEIAEQLHTIARHESDTAFSRQLSPEDDNRLQAILERLDAHEQHTNSAIGAMELRLEDMSQRLSHAPDHAAPQRAEDVPGYRALEGALRNIIEHIEVSETRSRESMKALQERLLEVMDQPGGETAAGPALGRLESRVAELAERMGRAEAAQPNDLSELLQTERRLRSLVAEARQSAGSIAVGENLSRLEADLKRQAGERDQAAQFEIAALGQRIAATEQRLEHLATIEKSVAELARSLKAGGSEAGNNAGASRELEALEEGLKAVRASADIADQRTQDTLQAVHETLQHIVARLAELEADDGPQGEVVAEALEEAPEEAREEASEEEQVSWLGSEPESAAALVEAERETDDAAEIESDREGFIFPEDAGSDETEPESHKEPEMQAPDMAAVDDHAAAEPASAPVREDYIAAARRAAQMAATRKSGFNRFSQRLTGTSTMPAKPSNGRAQKRGFVSSLLAGLRRRKAKPQDEAQAIGKKSKRKRLIFAGLVLLAAAAAYGAQRQAASLPDISLLGNFLAPETISEAETRTGVHPHDALTTGSIAPVTSGETETGSGVAKAPPAPIGPQSLLKAAIAGDPTAQFVVAGRYLDGQGVARDEQQAAQWYGRAAKQGLAAAQYRLGSMYEHGRGVAVDRKLAKSWYEQAAAQGNINAMHNLAVLHADAGSGERNYQMAASWFRKAAERGLKDSQFNLAVLSEQGLGVARNPQDAVFWYSLAAVQGDSEAAAKAKAIEAGLADDLAKQVHARLLAWRPLSADRNANVVPVGDPSWLETS